MTAYKDLSKEELLELKRTEQIIKMLEALRYLTYRNRSMMINRQLKQTMPHLLNHQILQILKKRLQILLRKRNIMTIRSPLKRNLQDGLKVLRDLKLLVKKSHNTQKTKLLSGQQLQKSYHSQKLSWLIRLKKSILMTLMRCISIFLKILLLIRMQLTQYKIE